VFTSALPVVSAVGHETDFTICDFVADARAPTPTGAAALVVPDCVAVRRDLAALAARWRHALARMLETRMQRVDGLARRLVHPAAKLAQQRRDVATLAGRLRRAMGHRLVAQQMRLEVPARRIAWRLREPLAQRVPLAVATEGLRRALPAVLERARARTDALARGLAHLNPRAVLERGYAIVATAEGAIVDDAAKLAAGDQLGLTFARGSAEATVTKVSGEST